MSLELGDLPPRCFTGIMPAIVATCSKDGEPNVTYASHVYRIDERRVALSRQFFNKTAKNVDENPRVMVQLSDSLTFDAYELELRFDHSETTGPLFDEMAVRIQVIAAHTGMKGVFRLLSADVYHVLSVRRLDGYVTGPAPATTAPAGNRGEIRALQVLSSRMNQARSLDELLGSLLGALREELGFTHAMVLLPDESGQRLFTIASIGYGESGVGSEVAVGEGMVGAVAAQRKILRFTGIDRDMRYGRAVRGEVRSASGECSLAPEIPLPGLPDAQIHMGIPLLVQDRLVGVLAVESRDVETFADWHEPFLAILANQAAIAIDTMTARDDDDSPSVAPAPPSRAAQKKSRRFRYYKGDDCVFVDGEYLIRNVPGRILWRILEAHAREKRTAFTNRELRLDGSLGLPAIKDNLESRLILLRKRLEQKCPDVRLPQTGRGHFGLELDCTVELEVRD